MSTEHFKEINSLVFKILYILRIWPEGGTKGKLIGCPK